MNKKTYCIYTDGSCDVNPGGNGGYAAVIFQDQNLFMISGYEPCTTNQRMELKAALEAIRVCDKHSDIDIFTDSAYMFNSFNKGWIKTWLKNGWRNSKGEPVANRDLIEGILKLIYERDGQVTFHKVKAHADDILNNKCDEMAKGAITFMLSLKKK